MPLPESFSVTRSAARVIISALAVSALSLSLVACSSPIVPETPGTTSQAPSSPAEPSSTPPTEPAADAANFAKLQAFVASQQAAVPQVLAQFPDTYSDFRLEAEAPGTVVFTYVYMGMMDPIVTAANFEATAAQQLQDACDTQDRKSVV